MIPYIIIALLIIALIFYVRKVYITDYINNELDRDWDRYKSDAIRNMRRGK